MKNFGRLLGIVTKRQLVFLMISGWMLFAAGAPILFAEAAPGSIYDKGKRPIPLPKAESLKEEFLKILKDLQEAPVDIQALEKEVGTVIAEAKKTVADFCKSKPDQWEAPEIDFNPVVRSNPQILIISKAEFEFAGQFVNGLTLGQLMAMVGENQGEDNNRLRSICYQMLQVSGVSEAAIKKIAVLNTKIVLGRLLNAYRVEANKQYVQLTQAISEKIKASESDLDSGKGWLDSKCITLLAEPQKLSFDKKLCFCKSEKPQPEHLDYDEKVWGNLSGVLQEWAPPAGLESLPGEGLNPALFKFTTPQGQELGQNALEVIFATVAQETLKTSAASFLDKKAVENMKALLPPCLAFEEKMSKKEASEKAVVAKKKEEQDAKAAIEKATQDKEAAEAQVAKARAEAPARTQGFALGQADRKAHLGDGLLKILAKRSYDRGLELAEKANLAKELWAAFAEGYARGLSGLNEDGTYTAP